MPRKLSALPGRKFRTICDVHREIYHRVQNLAPETRKQVLPLLQDAFEMGKKMNNKLRQYAKGYDKGWWERHRLDGGELTEADTIVRPGRAKPVDNSVTTNSSRRKRKRLC